MGLLVVQVHVHVTPECVGAFIALSRLNAKASLEEPAIARFAADGRLAIFGRGALHVGPASAAEILGGIRKPSGTLWDVSFSGMAA